MGITGSSWQGRLGVCYSRRQGQTHQRLTEIQAPFKLQRPFYPEGKHRCQGIVLHTAGGLVGGDRLELEATLEPGAEALLTTVAATKIYGPGRLTQGLGAGTIAPQGSADPIAPSSQQIRWQLEADSHGEWLPLETIAYGGARHHQTVRVELGTGATWLGWELVRLGRSARGETFGGGEWRSQTEVWQDGKPLWIDPLWIPGEPELLNSAQGLAGQPVLGTLAWVGQPVERESVAQVRQLWADWVSRTGGDRPGPRAEVGVTRLERGLLCRYRGGSTAEARAWFQLVWGVVRSLRGADRPGVPRVWP